MKAEEIRVEFSTASFKSAVANGTITAETLDSTAGIVQVQVLGEIAAQLAELNDNLKALKETSGHTSADLGKLLESLKSQG